MTAIIIGVLGLTLFQLWLLPASTNINNIAYLLGGRDDEPPEQSLLQGRISRAGVNLNESLPAFLALSLLSMIQNIDLTQIAMVWVGLRILYLLCYMFNIIYVRTIIWLGSLGCLIYMACKLLG